MKVVLASNNPGKIREFSEILAAANIELVPQSAFGISDIEETGLSFIENAILKARHAAKISGLPALADDSGIAVDILNGAPGIYSARYAGEPSNAKNNIQKLLTELGAIPADKRQASFHCALAFLHHANDPTPIIAEGKWLGMIATESHGENGFGYDPIFFVPSENKTAAEIPASIKNRISHRSRALQLLLTQLSEKL